MRKANAIMNIKKVPPNGRPYGCNFRKNRSAGKLGAVYFFIQNAVKPLTLVMGI